MTSVAQMFLLLSENDLCHHDSVFTIKNNYNLDTEKFSFSEITVGETMKALQNVRSQRSL